MASHQLSGGTIDWDIYDSICGPFNVPAVFLPLDDFNSIGETD